MIMNALPDHNHRSRCQGTLRLQRAPAGTLQTRPAPARCSAGFQPAVSPTSSRQTVVPRPAAGGLETRDTAGWKPALRGSGPAFTLIELLVVVAIIAILAALLLPVLGAAKEKARQIQCLSNLKQWALAFSLYSDDNDFIPREGFRNDGTVRVDNWAQVRDPISKDVWYNALPPLMGEQPARNYASSMTGQRAKFYESRVFHCPSALSKFPPGMSNDNSACFSVAMNSKLIQRPLLYPEASIPFGIIARPSDTVAFLEERVNRTEAFAAPGQSQFNLDLGQPAACPTRFAIRHRLMGNLAFCDGRAAFFRGPQVVETRPGRSLGMAIYPDGDILWCANPADDPRTEQ
jgi:prepilin-type N-terminal cleavage/methylation domain-containing protein